MTSASAIPYSWLRSTRTSILEKMYHNGIRDNQAQSFITRKRLLEVWLNRKNGSCPLEEVQLHIPVFSQDDILNHLLNIISILVLILCDDWSSLTNRFGLERNQFNDRNLPLSPEQCEEIFPHSPYYAADFLGAQFAFVPVTIVQNKYLRKTDSNWRLPLSFEGHPPINTGSYGIITKVGIANGYFKKEDGTIHDGELVVARKLFPIQPSYERELRNLTILRSSVLNHDRIMKHLGSIIIGETFNIFFQWAELNLEQFFNDEERPATIRNDMITPKNLLKESTWLASALEYLHNQLLDEDGRAVHCCHMDLKPDNILVMLVDHPSYPLGKWKIADFGISNIEPRSMSVSIRDFYARTMTTRPGTLPAPITSMRYPGPFQPPEAESSAQTRHMTRGDLNDLKGDIWSFGCILLVVLVFATGGTPYIDELADRRQVDEVDFDGYNRTGYFYRKVMGPPQIMPPIVNWITQLATTQAPWFGEAWSVISRHMLVADPARRIGAEVIRHKLSEWSGKAESSNIWSQAPHPPPLLLPSAVTGPAQVLTSPPSTNVTGDPAVWPSERYFRSTQSPTVAPIPEHAESMTPIMTSRSFTHSENFPAVVQTPIQGYSPGSGSPSQRSSISNRSSNSGPIGNLSQDLIREKNVVMSSDGQRICFWNQKRAKVFSKRRDDVAVFSKEIVLNIESRPSSTWDQIHFAGPVLALRDRDTLNVYSRNLMTEPSLQAWEKKVATQDVVGYDVSPMGAMAFRFPRAIKVFTSTASQAPNVDCTMDKETIKTVAFNRVGDRFIAVSDTAWFLWEQDNKSDFKFAMQGKHNFSRPEHGKFEPRVVPFNNGPKFVLWDHANPDRISIITKNYNTMRTVPRDTRDMRAVAISCDDHKLVLLTVKPPPMVLGKHKYILQWTDVSVDQTGHLTVGGDYQKYECRLRSSAELPLSMITLKEDDNDIVLVAFSDGHIERAVLK